MDIKELIRQKADTVNDALKRCSEHEKNPQSLIYDAMDYSLFAGGKRLRPVIMLMVCDMLSGDEREVMPFACAMEMIHTYSLIHDDLPSMDNDDYRRGKLTNHKVYGEAIAILAGDALLNKAFETVTSAHYKNTGSAMRAMEVLCKSSGTEGMIGGQTVDIESEGKKISPEELLYLHSLKTGAIIRSSGVIGAIMSGADDEQIDAVDAYCKNLGIAFQIQDDILDVLGNEETLGKATGSDDANEKTTFVTLYGIEKSKEAVENYTNKACGALSMFGSAAEPLTALAHLLVGRSF